MKKTGFDEVPTFKEITAIKGKRHLRVKKWCDHDSSVHNIPLKDLVSKRRPNASWEEMDFRGGQVRPCDKALHNQWPRGDQQSAFSTMPSWGN